MALDFIQGAIVGVVGVEAIGMLSQMTVGVNMYCRVLGSVMVGVVSFGEE